jgi:hypothetical protein
LTVLLASWKIREATNSHFIESMTHRTTYTEDQPCAAHPDPAVTTNAVLETNAASPAAIPPAPSKNESGCGLYGDRKPEPLQSFDVIALKLIFVDLLQVSAAKFLVRTIGFQHRVGND